MNKKKKDLEKMKANVNVDYHTVELSVLLERFKTDATKGLTSEAAATAFQEYGPNSLTPPKQKSEWLKFASHFTSGFSLLLSAGSLMCFIAYGVEVSGNKDASQDNLWLGIVLIAVVIITAIFGYYQESKSSKIMESFKKLIPQSSSVVRDGRVMKLKAHEIVPGDIVNLVSGDQIPADIRVIEAKGFKVDNSSVTGEAEPQKRGPECTSDELIETQNIALAFTYVVDGTGKGVVVSTGDNTFMGKIACLTSNIDAQETPIRREIHKFIRLISIIAFIIGIIFFALSLAVAKEKVVAAFVFWIGITVANVPEGLLLTLTIQLSVAAKKMAKKYCLVKNLESVETLGSTSVICSDKTGTLTQNRMTVAHIWTDCRIESTSTCENTKKTAFGSDSEARSLLLKACALCNRAEFLKHDENLPILQWPTDGDASESALLKFYAMYKGSIDEIRSQHLKFFEIPFNSTNKYHLCLFDSSSDTHYLLMMKGAPERIVEKCSTILVDSQERELNTEFLKQFNDAYEEMGGMGERVLGFCCKYLSKSEFPNQKDLYKQEEPTFPLKDFQFLGLASMIDPPRAAVPNAVKVCRSAGIKVIMVTGDHSITARAIAKNVGIITKECETYNEFVDRLEKDGKDVIQTFDNRSIVVTGSEIKELDSNEIDNIIACHSEIVFARTSPQQKLIIVEGFQRSGAVVAVTGDGVNDAPALKQADIGVAMGISGSDVAKQAADMILLDDNFASIVTGVEEGRLIFDNLKKSIAYTLTSNIPEIVPFALFVLAKIPLPLGTITILCIDLGTDLVPAISLAYEKAESDIMRRKPRDAKKDSLVNAILINYSYLLVGVYQAASAMIIYLIIMLDNGFTWPTLTVGPLWNDPKNLYVLDAFQQEWSYTARKDLEYTVNTAYFFTIVIVQIADLLLSKTRRMSIFRQGIFSNKMLIFGIFFEVLLALLITYAPFMNTVLNTRPVHPKYLIPAFILSIILWLLDELRRFFMRRKPSGFIQRETYY